MLRCRRHVIKAGHQETWVWQWLRRWTGGSLVNNACEMSRVGTAGTPPIAASKDLQRGHPQNQMKPSAILDCPRPASLHNSVQQVRRWLPSIRRSWRPLVTAAPAV